MSVDSERLAAGAPPHAELSPPVRRPVSKKIALIGVVGALTLGLMFGVWAKPDLGRSKPPTPMQPAGRTVDIEITNPPPPPVTPSAGKLEVLPQDLAQMAARAAQSAQGLPPPPPLPLPLPAQSAPPARLAVPSFAPTRASFDCAGAASLGERMVCEDPGLAAADRQMSRAYRRALDAGAPPAELREDQRDWLDIREVAARRSPGAVAAIYRQRIAELEELADDPPN